MATTKKRTPQKRRPATRKPPTAAKNMADARGITTSEFWLAVLMIVAALITELNSTVDSKYLSLAAIGSVFLYKVSRLLLKLRRSAALNVGEEYVGEIKESFKDIREALSALNDEREVMRERNDAVHSSVARMLDPAPSDFLHPVSPPPPNHTKSP